MLALRLVIGLLGIAGVIVGVLGLLTAGWLAVAVVVVGAVAAASAIRWLARHARGAGSPPAS
jgi:hypothetical protein